MVHRTILTAIAGVLLVVATGCEGDQRDQPAVAEKPLKHWVVCLLSHNPEVRERAAQQILSDFGLEIWVWSPEERFDSEAETFRSDHKSLAPLLLEAMKVNEKDDISLLVPMMLAVALGPEAKSMLPELKELAGRKTLDEASRFWVYLAILSVTPEDQAVGPFLLKSLNALSKETLQEYQEQGKFSRKFVAEEISVYAGWLIKTGHTKLEVPYLCKVATGDYPVKVRAVAIGILGAFELDAKAALPTLRQLLEEEDPMIRAWAADSLLRIERDKNRVPVLIQALKFEGKERQEWEQSWRKFFESEKDNRKYFEEIDENDDILLPELVGMLKYGSGFYRRKAMRSLAIIGPEARQVLPLLKESLDDSDQETRQLAADAIKKIESK